MCGRYQFTAEQCEEIQKIVQEVEQRCGRNAWKPDEICPSVQAPVLVERQGKTTADLMRWGFHTQKSLVINARAESVEEKPLFRNSVLTQRCIIPATGFFEWNTDKRKHLFHLPDAEPIYMAGIYDQRQGEDCYCILTTEANESVRGIHPRMPLVLEKDEINSWMIDPAAYQMLLKKTPPQFLATAVDNQTSLW